MKAHGHPLSPPSLFIWAVGEHLELPVEEVTVDLF